MIAKPLTNLLRKDMPFIWTRDHDVAFDTLKSSLVSAPVLAQHYPILTAPLLWKRTPLERALQQCCLKMVTPWPLLAVLLGSKTRAFQLMRRSISLSSLQWTNGDLTCSIQSSRFLQISAALVICQNSVCTHHGNNEYSLNFWDSITKSSTKRCRERRRRCPVTTSTQRA